MLPIDLKPHEQPHATQILPAIEWPTLGLTIVIYGLWLGLTWFHGAIPWPLLLIGGAWIIAWHG